MNELVLTQLCIACSFIRLSLSGPGFSFGLHPVLFWLLEKDLGVCSETALWGGIRSHRMRYWEHSCAETRITVSYIGVLFFPLFVWTWFQFVCAFASVLALRAVAYRSVLGSIDESSAWPRATSERAVQHGLCSVIIYTSPRQHQLSGDAGAAEVKSTRWTKLAYDVCIKNGTKLHLI